MATTTEVITEVLTSTKGMHFAFRPSEGRVDEKDYLLDMNTLLRRAQAGNEPANRSAKLLAGLGYCRGWFGFPVNFQEGEKYLREVESLRGLEKADAYGCVAQGYCKEHGLLGIEQNFNLAKGCYGAADKYFPAKFLYVSATYDDPFSGTGEKRKPLPRDYITGTLKKELMQCVEAEFVPAIAFLGKRLLTDGWCVDIDRDEGLRLLKEAANKGDAPSSFFLGEIYSSGKHGVKVDKKEAVHWFTLASNQNYPGADTALRQIAKKGGCIIV